MKKQIIYSLVGMALVGTSAVVHAQGVPSPIVVPTAAQPSVVVSAPVAATSVAPISAAAAKKAKMQAAAANLTKGLQARIDALNIVANNIQSRIGKLQQSGKDMTAATKALTSAQAAIVAANKDLVTLEKRIATMVSSKNPKAEFATVKKSATLGTVAKIKAVYKALVDTIVIIKGQGTPVAVPSTATTGTSTVH